MRFSITSFAALPVVLSVMPLRVSIADTHDYWERRCSEEIHDLKEAGRFEEASAQAAQRVREVLHDPPVLTKPEDYCWAVLSRRVAIGKDNLEGADELDRAANLFLRLSSGSEAISSKESALAIREQILGNHNVDVANRMVDLALLCVSQQRKEYAEALFTKALGVYEETLSADKYYAKESLGLIQLLEDQGRFDEAQAQFNKFAPVLEKALGLVDSNVAAISYDLDLGDSVKNLAVLYSAQKLANVAALNQKEGHLSAALSYSRRATTVLTDRMNDIDKPYEGDFAHAGDAFAILGPGRPVFQQHVAILSHAEQVSTRTARESFEMAQLALPQDTAGAVLKMAARFVGKRNEGLKSMQDYPAKRRALETRLANERDPAKQAKLREEASSLDIEFKASGLAYVLDSMDSRDWRASDSLKAAPVKLEEAERLLRPDEALLEYLVGEEESWLWVVRSKGTQWFPLPIGRAELSKQVQVLRSELDQSDRSVADPQSFNVLRAYHLYQALLARAAKAKALEGVSKLIVVPDGPLQGLPFAVLVTSEVKNPVSFDDYRSVPWLMERYIITTAPGVGTVKALRQVARASAAREPFVGFGDPVLEGRPGGDRGLSIPLVKPGESIASAVRKLPRLPETASELQAMATALKAGPGNVHVQDEATVPRVFSADLRQFRVVAFSTHALVSGERGQTEPALVLTPPPPGAATQDNDGLLTAGAVATLELDADWVVLSACNTAAPDGTPGAEGLSGLAKAFFYAGSRSVLVSHWSVDSLATQQLMTVLFEGQAQPRVGRSEALREAMRKVRDDPRNPRFAHPYYWAPFVVVGEGNAAIGK